MEASLTHAHEDDFVIKKEKNVGGIGSLGESNFKIKSFTWIIFHNFILEIWNIHKAL